MSIASWEVEVFFRHSYINSNAWSMLDSCMVVNVAYKNTGNTIFFPSTFLYVQPCLNVKTFSCIIDINYQLNLKKNMFNKLHKHHQLCSVWLNLSSSLFVLIMTNNYSNMMEITSLCWITYILEDGRQYIKSTIKTCLIFNFCIII